MATFHPSCRTRIVHIRCYRYFSTVASRSMAINERDKLHKLEREKEKATSFQHPTSTGEDWSIGRTGLPPRITRVLFVAKSTYARPGCPSHTSRARNRLLKVPPSFSPTTLFLVCGNNTRSCITHGEYRRTKSYVGHTQCPDAGLAPLAYKQKHVPRRRRRAESKDREKERYSLSNSTRNTKNAMEFLNLSYYDAHTLNHASSWRLISSRLRGSNRGEEEEEEACKGCLFISCNTVGRIFFPSVFLPFLYMTMKIWISQ